MRLLLDTHALAWFAMDRPSLSPRAREALEDAASIVFVSAVSAFEIATKHRIGKWPEVAPLVADFEASTAGAGLHSLPMTDRHAIVAGSFRQGRGDPFDRLLAAQALVEAMPIVSIDEDLDAFGIQRFW